MKKPMFVIQRQTKLKRSRIIGEIYISNFEQKLNHVISQKLKSMFAQHEEEYESHSKPNKAQTGHIKKMMASAGGVNNF